ncbi:hypothetical protein [Vallitalea okinawensis]|uniref:hypothetical protein n=1 Tax=Vallitalea okinawensis TaxID=2078660 RepID=UPI000CFB97A8|nr:hypothetical protein [Vallitalea okinawensis]
MHQNVNLAEIAQKLQLSIDEVSKSDAIQNTFMQIKNDPSISEQERESMYQEMASIYKSMASK